MFEAIERFEQALAEFTDAPYAVMTDCCTHAIELCLRLRNVKQVKFTAFTYLSIPMTMHKLGIDYELVPEKWTGEYRFYGTDIWDSARRLERNMYREGQMQCLSFGYSKPVDAGRGGAILLDDVEDYDKLRQMRYDGRDLQIKPWQNQQVFHVGYHYRPSPEEADHALEVLMDYTSTEPKFVEYPDLREIKIID